MAVTEVKTCKLTAESYLLYVNTYDDKRLFSSFSWFTSFLNSMTSFESLVSFLIASEVLSGLGSETFELLFVSDVVFALEAEFLVEDAFDSPFSAERE